MKAKASTYVARLELLEQELQGLEERVLKTKQLVEAEKASLAATKREVQDLSTELRGDLEVLGGLHRQLVGGDDREDEAVIA